MLVSYTAIKLCNATMHIVNIQRELLHIDEVFDVYDIGQVHLMERIASKCNDAKPFTHNPCKRLVMVGSKP